METSASIDCFCLPLEVSLFTTVILSIKQLYINGCFWHMHDCENFVWPKSNTEYWTNKLINNKNRDKKYHDQMKEKGWKVIIVWECEINESRLNRLISEIKGE